MTAAIITPDRPFIVRPYSKAELANMYLPHCTRRVALRKFNTWLRLDPTLWEQLRKEGFTMKIRYCNRAQVQLIVQHLGEP